MPSTYLLLPRLTPSYPSSPPLTPQPPIGLPVKRSSLHSSTSAAASSSSASSHLLSNRLGSPSAPIALGRSSRMNAHQQAGVQGSHKRLTGDADRRGDQSPYHLAKHPDDFKHEDSERARFYFQEMNKES